LSGTDQPFLIIIKIQLINSHATARSVEECLAGSLSTTIDQWADPKELLDAFLSALIPARTILLRIIIVNRHRFITLIAALKITE
jgi:hypothetical protein